MKNAEHVNVFFIQTDMEAVFIPREVVQDGLSINAEKFTKKIYFKQQKNVCVDYFFNLTAEEKSIQLDGLKQVRVRERERERERERCSSILQ